MGDTRIPAWSGQLLSEEEAPMRVAALGIATMLGMTCSASADPWKDESGKGRWGGGDRRYYQSYSYDREYKQEYRQRDCKVERKWERDGGYKEETKCKGYR
jgi:hypothetical protein